ncbi:hypothetical protein [Macrococcoides caseolyticum]|uniref:Uncharacterized protein n=1 Tax=Macrococcoides caseolyticum TaxID=69966 RepID=A0ACC9MQG8_9STAP|nr:hypothetical protein [Macrococcus caseolyticus]PKE38506.1 hypothetical protein CW675_10655 [Macrococcus caseolyticus]PKE55665.1 hypothetical protein CW682_10715 [Macrococcus caseolyticus]
MNRFKSIVDDLISESRSKEIQKEKEKNDRIDMLKALSFDFPEMKEMLKSCGYNMVISEEFDRGFCSIRDQESRLGILYVVDNIIGGVAVYINEGAMSIPDNRFNINNIRKTDDNGKVYYDVSKISDENFKLLFKALEKNKMSE